MKIGRMEIEEVSRILKSQNLSSVVGTETATFEAEFVNYLQDTTHAIGTSSGTAALHALYTALPLKPGDEVIVPAFTFISPVSMILACGATPVFADLMPGSLSLNPVEAEKLITDKTVAIVVVHIAGIPGHMEAFKLLAEHYDLWLIEDACQALGSKYDGIKLGTIGDAGVFSFYPSKIMTTGEGGMIVTENGPLAERCRETINQGMKGKYNYNRLGFNYRMTEVQAALGRVQLMRLDEEIARRNKMVELIKKTVQEAPGMTTVLVLRGSEVAYSFYPIITEWEVNEKARIYPKPLYHYPLFSDFIPEKEFKFTEWVTKHCTIIPFED